MKPQRRGFMLIEMVTVLLMVGVGGTLMALAVGSILRSQRRVAEFSNQYAEVNDFIRCLSRDVRMSATAVLQEGDGDGLRQVLLLGDPPRQVSFRFYGQSVERTVSPGSALSAKLWTPLEAVVKVISSQPGTDEAAVGVTIRWHRADAKDPEPNHRFDLVVRCARELGHEED